MSKFYSNNQRDITWQSTKYPFKLILAHCFKKILCSQCGLTLTCKYGIHEKLISKCMNQPVQTLFTLLSWKNYTFLKKVSEHDFIIFATLWNLKTPHTKSLSENPCPDLRTSHSYKKHVFLFQNTGLNVFLKIMSSFGNNVIVAQLNIHSPFFQKSNTKFCLSQFQTVETVTFFSHWAWCAITL